MNKQPLRDIYPPVPEGSYCENPGSQGFIENLTVPDDMVIEDFDDDEEEDECDDDPWEGEPDEDDKDDDSIFHYHTAEEYEEWEYEWHPENFEGERKEGSAE